MAKSSSGGFGIGTIIFWVIMYNVFFSSDDEDTSSVEADTPSIVDQVAEKVSEKFELAKKEIVFREVDSFELAKERARKKRVRVKKVPEISRTLVFKTEKTTEKAKIRTTEKANESPEFIEPVNSLLEPIDSIEPLDNKLASVAELE